jgi:hypothetical protein
MKSRSMQQTIDTGVAWPRLKLAEGRVATGRSVAQTSGLLYRRLPVCKALDVSRPGKSFGVRQTGGLRYSRPEVCATGKDFASAL